MRDLVLPLVVVIVAGPVLAAGSGDAIAAAHADAKQLAPAQAATTRYLTLDAVPITQRKEVRAAVDFWANSLSREAEIVRPRIVSGEVLAVNLIDYGWSAKTWDGFAFVDPYYTVRLVTPWPGGLWTDGRSYARGSFNVTSTASAPWLDALAMAELYQRTGSKAPILRADWWLAQVAVQADRKGTGYYDMLGLGKKRADFEKLVALDRATATKLRKEVAAIVDVSSVALHNRQVYRYQTLTGPYYETRDAKDNRDRRNAVRMLNGDYQHDAEEIYGTLPNGLFAFYLSDAVGNRADTAPDFIASDGRSASTDRRVHVGLSCVRCHVEGIRPIDCWARRAYAAPDKLEAADPARFLRLRQLYLSDIGRLIQRDQSDYAAALLLTNGLTPGDNAKVIAAVWERYVEQPVTLEDLARETGCKPEELVAAIREKNKTQVLDPILLAIGKQMTLRREYVEEAFPVLMGLLLKGE